MIFFKKKEPQTIHFLHIGKTGGTALKGIFKEFNKSIKDFHIILHIHKIKLSDIPNGEKFIFILRDPFSRFISGFYSRQRQGAPRYSSSWNNEEKKAFTLFHTPNELAEALSDKNHTNYKDALSAMKGIRHVKTHYYDWFTSLDYFMTRKNDIFFIGFQEQLDDDFIKLKEKLNIPEHIVLPHDDVTAHKNPIKLDKKLSDKSLACLNEWFKDDIFFLDICKELKT